MMTEESLKSENFVSDPKSQNFFDQATNVEVANQATETKNLVNFGDMGCGTE